MAWVASGKPVTIEETRTDFNGSEYFTDGYTIVIWSSGTPVSLLEATSLDWDDPPLK